MCYIAQGLINEGKMEGKAEAWTEGLAALVKTLKPFMPEMKELYKAVTANKIYAHATEEQVRMYYEE